MFKKIKLGLTLIKYGFRPKTNIIMCALFVLVGLAVEISAKGTNMIGAFYMLITAIFTYQMIISMDVSTLVQTSKLKKSLQTTIPAVTSLAMYLVIFTVISVERVILSKINPASETDLAVSTLLATAIMFLAMVYMGMCFKYFIAATVVYAFTALVGISVCNMYIMLHEVDLKISTSIVIGYVLIFIGAVIQYGLSCLFYRKELSKFAFKGIFGKIQ